ncbi:MAG TPA: YceI family protein [Gammaproteobacteria bacterium]|nr:YceI family protein [Gammaproteobacteria bacterium]
MNRLLLTSLSATLVLIAACQPAPRPSPPSPVVTAPTPESDFPGAERWPILAAESELRILVYRGGALAKFGHNHVIVSRDLRGTVYRHRDFERSGFEFSFPVASLVVDDPALRREEGDDFASVPSPADIEGTRRNMLRAEVLDAERFPEVQIRSIAIHGTPADARFVTRVTLRGASRELVVPAVIESEERRLVASGIATLRQSDFAMTPFSILGGALKVADDIVIKFRIVAVAPDT